jgi:hypothetical protein
MFIIYPYFDSIYEYFEVFSNHFLFVIPKIAIEFTLDTKGFEELFTKNLFKVKHLIYLDFILLSFMRKFQAN